MKIILIGKGKLVYFLAKNFISNHHDLTIITNDPKEATELAHQFKVIVILGDGSHPNTLKDAETYRADILLSLTFHDEDNLVACQIAQKLYGVPRTIALVNDPEHQEIFRKLGITTVFSITQILANLIEEQTVFQEIDNLVALAEGKVTITEFILPRDSSIIGKTLQDIGFPEQTLIACIIRDSQVTIPKGNSILLANDRLILISQPETQELLLSCLKGETKI
jgi:trk system potassium uptake protein